MCTLSSFLPSAAKIVEDMSALDVELGAAASAAKEGGADISPPSPAPHAPKKTLLDVYDALCLAGFEREGTRLLSISRPLLAAGEACLGTGRAVYEAAARGDAAALELLLLRWHESPSASSVVNWSGGGKASTTPLIAACEAGHEAAVALLLSPVAPAVNRRAIDANRDDALVHAIRSSLSTATVDAMRRDWGLRSMVMLKRDLVAVPRDRVLPPVATAVPRQRAANKV